MSFIQPPFWAQPYGPTGLAPHAIVALVTPAVAIASSSVANPSVLATSTPHYLVTGDTVTVAGHAGSTPTINGSQVVTVVDATHVSIPVNVSVGGTGGTITRTTAVEPVSVAQAKTYARRAASDTSLDTLWAGIISTARIKVQQDTAIVLLTEIHDVYYDSVPRDRTPIELPYRPVQAITWVQTIDTAGVVNTVTTDQYVVDPSSATSVRSPRLGLSTAGIWPTDLRPFQPLTVRMVVGLGSIAAIPAPLVQAVGLLCGFYANEGSGRFMETMRVDFDTYEETIAPYRPVLVA